LIKDNFFERYITKRKKQIKRKQTLTSIEIEATWILQALKIK
jgi:hypothetical protein